jgi:hypothetical protein
VEKVKGIKINKNNKSRDNEKQTLASNKKDMVKRGRWKKGTGEKKTQKERHEGINE